MRFGRLMTKDALSLPLLEMLNEDKKDIKELGISHLNREVLFAARSSFFVLLMEAAYLYMNNCTKSAATTPPSFFRYAKQLLQKLYNLLVEFDKLLKLNSLFS